MTKQTRIEKRFNDLKKNGRAGLVVFITAGDPDLKTSAEILSGLANSGADIIELGMPFSDPMADGPPIQASSQRALKSGQNMNKTLQLVRNFRKADPETPLVLMGYYNPIYVYGNEKFLKEASEAGVDGLIIVDLPPEADDELCIPALSYNINFIRLTTPTTDELRLKTILKHSSGFIYYVSIAGITGASAPEVSDVARQISRIKAMTQLPVVVGFGIKTPSQAAEFAKIADGVVVGSAIVTRIFQSLDPHGHAKPDTAKGTLQLVESLSKTIRNV
ncbi:MAG: tryptophan synthase subunit alpha [Hyphomicrobium sp.]